MKSLGIKFGLIVGLIVVLFACKKKEEAVDLLKPKLIGKEWAISDYSVKYQDADTTIDVSYRLDCDLDNTIRFFDAGGLIDTFDLDFGANICNSDVNNPDKCKGRMEDSCAYFNDHRYSGAPMFSERSFRLSANEKKSKYKDKTVNRIYWEEEWAVSEDQQYLRMYAYKFKVLNVSESKIELLSSQPLAFNGQIFYYITHVTLIAK